MPRSRQVFDRLTNLPRERNNGVYFRVRKIRQAIKSLTDLTRQLMQYSGWTPLMVSSPAALTNAFPGLLPEQLQPVPGDRGLAAGQPQFVPPAAVSEFESQPCKM
jgi:hypothetical protein